MVRNTWLFALATVCCLSLGVLWSDHENDRKEPNSNTGGRGELEQASPPFSIRRYHEVLTSADARDFAKPVLNECLTSLKALTHGAPETCLEKILAAVRKHPVNNLALMIEARAFVVVQGLWQRAPKLREVCRALFLTEDNARAQRFLFNALYTDRENITDLEYDCFQVLAETEDYFLFVDLASNIHNFRNREITRAALDFALGIDPSSFADGNSERGHAGLTAVLNAYRAMLIISRSQGDDQWRSTVADLKSDLGRAASLDIPDRQLWEVIQLLQDTCPDEAVVPLTIGTTSSNPTFKRWCLEEIEKLRAQQRQ